MIYDLLFKASSETLLTIAADPKHLGARIGITSVLHTWGSAMTHHPHVHMIVPGGGISLDGERWVACRPGFFLPVRVLSHLFRRLLLEKLVAAHAAGKLQFFGDHAALADAQAFAAYLAPLRRAEWVVYAKRPFAGPQAVLAYLSRYTHRVAISNRRLIAVDEDGVTFRWKDYRVEGRDRHKIMTLAPTSSSAASCSTSCPRLPPHPPLRAPRQRARAPKHRPRPRAARRCRNPKSQPTEPPPITATPTCPCCGGRMIIVETFERGAAPGIRQQLQRPDQDRHLMTAPQSSPQRKPAALAAAGDRPTTPSRSTDARTANRKSTGLGARSTHPPLLRRRSLRQPSASRAAIDLQSRPHPRHSNPHSPAADARPPAGSLYGALGVKQQVSTGWRIFPSPVSLFDLKARFFVPTRSFANAVARRGCQDWPSLESSSCSARCQATP